MTSRLNHITVDCSDTYQLAAFWSQVTGRPMHADDNPGDPEAILLPTDDSPGTTILFVQNPDAKTVKNRVHVDITPTDRTRDEEVERLLAIGATLVGDQRRPDGRGWVTLADPEGNEFCVERSEAERAA